MAVPFIYTDFQQLNPADSETGWDDFGNNAGKWDPDNDIYIEGAASITVAPNALGESGNGYDNGTTFDLDNNYAMVWMWVVAKAFVSTVNTKGAFVRLGSGATPQQTNYRDYLVGGRDADWVGTGWHLAVVDSDWPATSSNGTYTSASATGIGAGYNVTATANKSSALAIDALSYGSVYALAGSPSSSAAVDATSYNFATGSADTGSIIRAAGSWVTQGFEEGDRISVENSENSGENDGEYTVRAVTATVLHLNEPLPFINSADTSAEVYAYVTLEDLVAADTTPWGAIVLNPVGGYDINFPFTIGDPTGNGGKVYFLSSGDIIRMTDQPILGGVKITTVESGSGKTVCRFGLSTGTGDNKVGFAGPVIRQSSYVTNNSASLDFSAVITDFEMNGTTILGLPGDITFSDTGSHTLRNTSFISCGQVDIGGTNTRGVIFTGHDTVSGSLYWDSASIDIKNSSFIANNAGVWVDLPGTVTLYNLLFAGNTYDLVNNSQGSVTASVQQGGTTPTTQSLGSSTTKVVSEYTLTLEEIISGSEVSLVNRATGAEIDHLENVDTDGLYTYSYNYTGTPVEAYAYIHNIFYVWQSVPVTLGDGDQTLTIQQVFDRNYSNP